MTARIGILTNPNSGKNRRNPGRLDELRRAVGRRGVVRQTQDVADLQTVVAEFLDEGFGYWVCDGGDGTLHWLLTTGHRLAMERGLDVLPYIVPANGGSIDFVAHKAGIRGRAADIVRTLVHLIDRGETAPIVMLDTLQFTGTGTGDEPMQRIGFASAIGGVAQRFFDKLYRYDRIDAWTIAMVLARSAAGGVCSSTPAPVRHYFMPGLQRYANEVFEPTRATVEVDGKRLAFDSFSSLQIGSIDISLGGVVRTFRHAANDGVLHAQALSTTRLGVVANLPNIVMGTPILGRNVYDGPIRELKARALPGYQLDPVIDGELLFGLSDLEVRQGPKMRVAAVCR